MKIVDTRQMEEIDKISQQKYAIPSLCLMENAGIKAYQYLKNTYTLDGLMVFLVGKGNNGGDALVMARQCYCDGKRDLCIILAAGEPAAGTDPAINLAACKALQIEIIDYGQQPEPALGRLHTAAWLVDSLFGTGLKDELRSPIRELVAEINRARGKKVAIDLPSGLGDQYKAGYSAVQADLTLTLGLPKNCLYLPHARSLCGDIIVIPLGFPPPLLEDESLAGELLEASSYLTKLPEIPRTAYKTKRGHLAVFAGSERTSGAAWLCTHAAARSRVGLVTFFADSDIYANVVGSYSSVIVHKWDPKKPEEGSAKDLSRLENYSAFLAGPGWGFAEEKKSWLLKLLANDRPGVIDADALRMIAEMREKGGIKVGPNRILTPHPGEFSAFLKVNIKDMLENPLPPLRSLCRELDAHIILKGHVTYIMAPDGRYKILDGMNPAMATGGTGDVLSGIVAGLLGQGVPVFEAAQAGAMLHACLGKQLYKEKGWFIAEDLLPLISPAMASPLY